MSDKEDLVAVMLPRMIAKAARDNTHDWLGIRGPEILQAACETALPNPPSDAFREALARHRVAREQYPIGWKDAGTLSDWIEDVLEHGWEPGQ